MSKTQIVNEIHQQARKNFRRRHVVIKGIDDLWQADLVEMGNYSQSNNGFKFLLTVIDTFSKFAWAVAIKNKSAKEVTTAIEEVFKLGRIPKNLQTDDGKEFFNSQFQALMKLKNIKHYSTYSVLKASIVERFNRTLKNMMWKEFSINGSYKWIELYKGLVNKYNNSIHRTIKMSPVQVNKANEYSLLNTVYRNADRYIFEKPKFNIGDNVRISKYKHVFEKGYTPNWTTEIFRIRQVQNTQPRTYLLEDYQGCEIKGSFYTEELRKTNYPNSYLVEKIIRRKGGKALVKWLGFSSEHNSWIDKDDIL